MCVHFLIASEGLMLLRLTIESFRVFVAILVCQVLGQSLADNFNLEE